MRHYEIVFLVHPDQSPDVPAMTERYSAMVTDAGGSIHRHEDWGRRQLAYPIADLRKAHYVLLNVECDQDTRRKIENTFKFSDAILRSLIIRRTAAVTEESWIAAETRREEERETARREREQRAAAEAAVDDSGAEGGDVDGATVTSDTETITPGPATSRTDTLYDRIKQEEQANQGPTSNAPHTPEAYQSDWFEWPSTVAPPGRGKILPVRYPEGLLSFVGYRVGKTKGPPDDDRKDILDKVFHNKLPRVNSDSYMAEFGDPEQPARLEKMAHVLAAMARNYSRNDTRDYSVAIRHYKMDLDYLYDKYYVGKFRFHEKPGGFEWPDLSDLPVESKPPESPGGQPATPTKNPISDSKSTFPRPGKPQDSPTEMKTSESPEGAKSESANHKGETDLSSKSPGEQTEPTEPRSDESKKPPSLEKWIFIIIGVAAIALLWLLW